MVTTIGKRELRRLGVGESESDDGDRKRRRTNDKASSSKKPPVPSYDKGSSSKKKPAKKPAVKKQAAKSPSEDSSSGDLTLDYSISEESSSEEQPVKKKPAKKPPPKKPPQKKPSPPPISSDSSDEADGPGTPHDRASADREERRLELEEESRRFDLLNAQRSREYDARYDADEEISRSLPGLTLGEQIAWHHNLRPQRLRERHEIMRADWRSIHYDVHRERREYRRTIRRTYGRRWYDPDSDTSENESPPPPAPGYASPVLPPAGPDDPPAPEPPLPPTLDPGYQNLDIEAFRLEALRILNDPTRDLGEQRPAIEIAIEADDVTPAQIRRIIRGYREAGVPGSIDGIWPGVAGGPERRRPPPLHVAAIHGRGDIVEALLQEGVDIDIQYAYPLNGPARVVPQIVFRQWDLEAELGRPVVVNADAIRAQIDALETGILALVRFGSQCILESFITPYGHVLRANYLFWPVSVALAPETRISPRYNI
ncbi:Uu.00g044560.m01.CDS01 [Anthostomella pinea]|uniref:Uu.00g044560.m01.CDS01 n=1 Tax=Anthostomella pinea TaxID=933095 RepID=A0AAI8YEG3_9PEZI|nr:Uu.00g044560.m01.CDS01 [Anthostomella pinea]